MRPRCWPSAPRHGRCRAGGARGPSRRTRTAARSLFGAGRPAGRAQPGGLALAHLGGGGGAGHGHRHDGQRRHHGGQLPRDRDRVARYATARRSLRAPGGQRSARASIPPLSPDVPAGVLVHPRRRGGGRLSRPRVPTIAASAPRSAPAISEIVRRYGRLRFLPGEDRDAILRSLPGRDRAIVSEPFANKHGVRAGDRLDAAARATAS